MTRVTEPCYHAGTWNKFKEGGTMGKTLSFGKGKGNIRHNNREFITENVDKERIQNNITYVKQDLHDAYVECFQQAIDDYNAKQTRNDRMKSLDGYMDEIKRNQANKNGEKLFYEQVVGIGDMYDSGIITKPQEAEKCKEVLDRYAKEFQQRNPNLHVFNMVLHMDEQTPHLHIDYIPKAEGYKQGLQVRNSLSKALRNQGLQSAGNKKDNNTISWQKRERQHISNLCQERGIEIVTIGVEREDMTIGQYKDYMKKSEKLTKDIEKQEVKKVNLPFGFKLETPKQARTIDAELERKDNLQKAEKAFEEATERFNDEKIRVAWASASVSELRLQAEKECRNATYFKERYKAEYDKQINLNSKYTELSSQMVIKNNEIKKLTKRNEELENKLNTQESIHKSEIESLKVRSAMEQRTLTMEHMDATQELNKKIENLKGRLDGMCASLAYVTKAFGMLKHDKNDGYQVELSKKQSRLFDAIENYVTHWLRTEKQEELAVDVEKHIGISKGIEKEIKALEPRSMDKGR